MSLKHGLLGFLSYSPKTGYKLAKMFFDPIKPSISLIYRKLNEMAEEGLVTFERVDQEKLPYRNVFHITPAGRAELERWLREPLTLVPPSQSVLFQLWFGSCVDKEDIIADIKAYAGQLREVLSYYQTEAGVLIKKGMQEYATPLDRMYWDLVVELAIQEYRLALKWAEAAIQQIASFEPSGDKATKTKLTPSLSQASTTKKSTPK